MSKLSKFFKALKHLDEVTEILQSEELQMLIPGKAKSAIASIAKASTALKSAEGQAQRRSESTAFKQLTQRK